MKHSKNACMVPATRSIPDLKQVFAIRDGAVFPVRNKVCRCQPRNVITDMT
jgi:hypothetical protein